jgi:uncharacterized protein (TIGR00297 family)
VTERSPTRENLRQIVHVGVGFLSFGLRYLTALPALLLTGALFVHNLVLLPRYGKALWRREERERGFATGVAIYPAILFLLVLAFRDRLHLAAGAWAILAFGDGAATLVGRNVASPPLPWNRAKSWAGSAAYLVVGALAAAGAMAFVAGAGGSAGALGFGDALLPAALAALCAAGAESLPLELNDNVSGPVAAAVVLWASSAVRPDVLSQGADLFWIRLPWVLGVTGAATIVALLLRVVDRSGAAAGWALAVVTWGFGGAGAFALFCAFVGIGTLATWVGRDAQSARWILRQDAERRKGSQALANTGVGAGLAFLAAATGRPEPHLLALAGAFAAATGDTVASELGVTLGKRPRSATSLRAVAPGTAGAVSVPGTVAGVLAVAVIASLGVLFGLYPLALAWVVIAAGVLALGIESIASALLESRGLVDHHVLNLFNTACGAGFCFVLAPGFGG